jgi:hypothetical protein
MLPVLASSSQDPWTFLKTEGYVTISYRYMECGSTGFQSGYYFFKVENSSSSENFRVQLHEVRDDINQLIEEVEVLSLTSIESNCENVGLKYFVFNPQQDSDLTPIENLNLNFNIIEL